MQPERPLGRNLAGVWFPWWDDPERWPYDHVAAAPVELLGGGLANLSSGACPACHGNELRYGLRSCLRCAVRWARGER